MLGLEEKASGRGGRGRGGGHKGRGAQALGFRTRGLAGGKPLEALFPPAVKGRSQKLGIRFRGLPCLNDGL